MNVKAYQTVKSDFIHSIISEYGFEDEQLDNYRSRLLTAVFRSTIRLDSVHPVRDVEHKIAYACLFRRERLENRKTENYDTSEEREIRFHKQNRKDKELEMCILPSHLHGSLRYSSR